MKKIFIILAFLITGFGADAAPARTAGAARAARSATTQRTATPRTPMATPNKTPETSSSDQSMPGMSTRNMQTIVSRAAAGRSATTPVVSRSAKQSVISTGTKVAAAAQNTVVDEKCWNGFMGCMDSFCMLDNANGGRCICSDKNAEYDSILAEIQSLDEQSYQMATVGVERIEMGDDANAVMKKTQEITKSIEKDSAQSKRKTLDLSAWDVNEIDFDAEVEDIFSLSSDGTGIANKTGDALYRAAAKLCNAQIPECKSQSTMMELMYKQRVRSDCTAYENSLRQQRTQSAQKLATAQSAMREAALEQYRNANKYDLGQCTVQFKQCMQTTGGCGDDFLGCVGSIQEVTTGVNFESLKQKKIKGTSSSITIAQSTYDILEAKKALCMTVTQQCVNVRDQVWDTFLREVAPQVKSAELMAESDMRSSCISNISTCFQKACKDNMDPNDPDGSYDMCLTRPDMVKDVCKIQVTPCENSIPHIMDYVTARLASMRVDACTREFKECLTSEDRCGADYTQCVGLDTDTIVKMCPRDKLVGCYNSKKPDADVYDELAEIATGIFLNIDNNMLSTCQKALDTAMLRVCGSTENCDDIVVDNGAGTRSLEYRICQYTSGKDTEGNFKPLQAPICKNSIEGFSKDAIKSELFSADLSGILYWGEISYAEVPNNQNEPQTKFQFTPIDKYVANVAKATGATVEELEDTGAYDIIRDRVYGIEIKALTSAVENAINAIESDQTVQYCMNGRTFQGMRDKKTGKLAKLGTKDKKEARFPNLTSQIRQMIANSALKNARENYMKKYDEEIERMMKDQVKAAQIADEESAKAKAVELCIAYGETASLPVTDTPKASNAGKWIAFSLLVAAAVAATIFTFGAGATVTAPLLVAVGTNIAVPTVVGTVTATTLTTAGIVSASVAGAAVAGATGIGISAANDLKDSGGKSIDKCENTMDANGNKVVGCSVAGQWNYKEKIVTIPKYETGECIKMKTTQNCEKTQKNVCKEWAEEVEEAPVTINLLN